MRRFLWLAAILAICAAPALAPRAQAGGSLGRAAGGEPQTLDPQHTTSVLETEIESDLFEGLTARGPDGKVQPGVAERWDVSADGKTWIFHLRPDARWSNGVALTAEDFVYALGRELDPASRAPMAAQLVNIAGAEERMAGKPAILGVTADDPFTLRIDLVRPSPFLAEMLSYPFAMPLYRPAVEADEAGWSKAQTLVSNGPFVLAQRVPQLALVLRRNPRFHDAAAVTLDEVRWRVLENDATALKLYRTGEVETAAVTEEDLEPARRVLAGELHVVPIFGTEFLLVNLRRKPLGASLALRRALALTIDRTVLADTIDPSGATRSCSYVPPNAPGYQTAIMERCDQPMPARQAEALALAAAAGVSPAHPLKLAMVYRTNRADRKRLAALAEMWKPLGIELTLVNREWRAYLEAMMTGDFDIAIAKAVGASGDPLEFLNGMRPHGEINLVDYRDAGFEALMHQAEDEPVSSTRNALLTRAEQRLLDAVPLIPIDTPVERVLVSPRVHGWQDNPFAFHPSRFLSVYAEAAAPGPLPRVR